MSKPFQMRFEYCKDFMCAADEPLATSNPEPNETCWIYPEAIGEGLIHKIEIRPGFEIWISDCTFKRDIVYPPHKLPPVVQSSFVLSGHYQLHIEGYPRVYEQVGERQGIICSNGETSICTIRSGRPIRHLGISLFPELFYSYFEAGMSPELRKVFEKHTKSLYQYSGRITPEMRSVIQQILTNPGRGITRKLFFESCALGLLAYQMEQMATFESRGAADKQIHPLDRHQTEQAKDYLVRNLQTPVSLGELSRKAGMSPPKLNRCFKQLYGMTVFNYLRTERLNEAREILENTGLSVTEAASHVGYDSPSHFAKAYKKRFGTSPRNTRSRQHRYP